MRRTWHFFAFNFSSEMFVNLSSILIKERKGAKIRNRYNQVPHLTQDTNGKVTNSQLDTTNESQEVSPFPAGDHKAHRTAPTTPLIQMWIKTHRYLVCMKDP